MEKITIALAFALNTFSLFAQNTGANAGAHLAIFGNDSLYSAMTETSMGGGVCTELCDNPGFENNYDDNEFIMTWVACNGFVIPGGEVFNDIIPCVRTSAHQGFTTYVWETFDYGGTPCQSASPIPCIIYPTNNGYLGPSVDLICAEDEDGIGDWTDFTFLNPGHPQTTWEGCNSDENNHYVRFVTLNGLEFFGSNGICPEIFRDFNNFAEAFVIRDAGTDLSENEEYVVEFYTSHNALLFDSYGNLLDTPAKC